MDENDLKLARMGMKMAFSRGQIIVFDVLEKQIQVDAKNTNQ